MPGFTFILSFDRFKMLPGGGALRAGKGDRVIKVIKVIKVAKDIKGVKVAKGWKGGRGMLITMLISV